MKLADCYKAERYALMKKHGYQWRRNEDGAYIHCPRMVKRSVRERLAKLEKLEDIARGRKPDWPINYWITYRARTRGRSERTFSKWMEGR